MMNSPGPAPRVRTATLGDAAAIGETHVEGWRTAYRGLLPADYLAALRVEDRQRMWERVIEHRPESVGLVVCTDRVAGFVSGGVSRDADATTDTLELFAIYAHPDYWGQGIGRALLTWFEERARHAGARHATLWVLRDNDRAIRFYEAHGWQADGCEKTVEIGGRRVVEVRYRRQLTEERT